MAVTTYGVNDAMAVKLWSKMLAAEALKATAIGPLIGTDTNSALQLKTELSKGPGDKVTFGLRAQLLQDGKSEGETLEGDEEALQTYSDSLLINELAAAVRVRNEQRIDAKRVPFNMRDESKKGLVDWYAKRMSVSMFNQLCGYTPANTVAAGTGPKYTGFNTVIAPAASRRVVCNASQATADESIASGDKMKLVYLDYAVELAKTGAGPVGPIRPLSIDGEDKYVVYLHPYQVTDLRTDASTAGNWFDITSKAIQGGQTGSKNPIYNGALGEYNGCVLRSAYDVTNGVNSSTGAAISTVKRAVLLGAQAGVIGFKSGYDDTTFDWVEELFDYERELGISAQTLFGMKKTIFNSIDFGTIVIASYGAKHTA